MPTAPSGMPLLNISKALHSNTSGSSSSSPAFIVWDADGLNHLLFLRHTGSTPIPPTIELRVASPAPANASRRHCWGLCQRSM